MEYYSHAEDLACMPFVSGTKLDEHVICCDCDLGYMEGRQYGQGKSGGGRSGTSIDKTTMQEGADGVHQLGDAR